MESILRRQFLLQLLRIIIKKSSGTFLNLSKMKNQAGNKKVESKPLVSVGVKIELACNYDSGYGYESQNTLPSFKRVTSVKQTKLSIWKTYFGFRLDSSAHAGLIISF